jgi:hypothetical protein
VAALVTSFSAGLGLVDTNPAQGRLLPQWAQWSLLGILLTIGICAFIVLLPTRQWLQGPSARIILERWAEGGDTTDVKVEVTEALVVAQRRNSNELGRRSGAYRMAIVLLLAQVLVLAAAVAHSSAA